MVYRTIIHLNIELQIPVIYRADFGLRGFTPLYFVIFAFFAGFIARISQYKFNQPWHNLS